MEDKCERKIDYVRVSVTDRCNLRCVYCMPKEGVQSAAHESILSYDEILRTCRCMAEMGISKVKLTGGEPLVRRNISHLVRELKGMPGIEAVTLTTNGVLLADAMEELKAAEIDGINISLDTLDDSLFQRITRRDLLTDVKRGIEAAKRAGVLLKINCVPLGLSQQDLIEIALLAKDSLIHVRFIEMMPIGYGKEFNFVGEEEILKKLRSFFGQVKRCDDRLGNGPGHYYTVPALTGKIGFISALSHKFCDSCNRIRLTSQGYLKSCLQYDIGCDLRSLLREGSTDEELKAAIGNVIMKKPSGHEFLAENISKEESHCMAQIGG